MELVKITDLPFYTEGPVVDKQGDFYCTTLNGGLVLKVDSRNKPVEWARCACPNGQFILPDGDHLICDSELGAVLRFNAEGTLLRNEIEGFCADERIFTPNDLVVDSQGNLYFTDSVRHTGKVFFIGIGGEQKVLIADLDYPNGLVLSHDERYLYVAESYRNRIIKLKLKMPGLGKGSYEVFADLPVHVSGDQHKNLPDGLALSKNGELLVAHYGMQAVQMLSAKGVLEVSVESGMPLTSNLCFLTEDSLLVTGGYGEPGPGGLFKIYF
ncbi:SMP-30/gluconolactonase/LRE family protein [Pedobacter heparinus]|uniref:SMP-30/gluconolactonase/LRE family protein n=1 Tax=Pedobacter heparinus TaxID=984 RepID=UPI00292EE7CF|nr:SMP-30/gluconolactonase/LRE family protein [Pedobacter heparinus]